MLCIDMYLLKDFKAAKRWFLVETDAFRADSSQSRKAKMVSFLNMFMVTLPDFISFFLSVLKYCVSLQRGNETGIIKKSN